MENNEKDIVEILSSTAEFRKKVQERAKKIPSPNNEEYEKATQDGLEEYYPNSLPDDRILYRGQTENIRKWAERIFNIKTPTLDKKESGSCEFDRDGGM